MTFDEILKGKVLTYNTNKAFNCNLPLSSLLSLPQRPFCVVGRLGSKKKKARGARLEGEREKRGLFPPFPSSLVPRALSIFFIIAIFIGIPSGSLCGGERMRHYR